MKRVMVIGQPGSGKSTLARKLAAATGLPVVHLDRIHWKPGWVERPLHEKIPMIRAEEEKGKWIIEGGLSATWDTRLERSDMLIWIDVGLTRRLWRVLRRSWVYRGQSRPDLTEGCPEQFSLETVEFVWFILRTWRPGRRRMARVFAAYNKPKIMLRSIPETEAWLLSLSR
ncbi:MAG: AAA family ATPase [Pseudomonadota bacterium]